MALYFNWEFVSLQKQHNLVILLPWICSSPSLVTSHDQWPGVGVPSLACIHIQGNHLFQMYSPNVIHKVLQSCQSSITSKVEKRYWSCHMLCIKASILLASLLSLPSVWPRSTCLHIPACMSHTRRVQSQEPDKATESPNHRHWKVRMRHKPSVTMS